MKALNPDKIHEGVYWATLEDGAEHLATVNLSPGRRVYDEQLLSHQGSEYRIWSPFRSKLAALLKKGIKTPFLRRKAKVLYLGAASGTTVSHVSDIVGAEGLIYAVEMFPRPMRDLLAVCEARPNIIPLLADARSPESYAPFLQKVDLIYQDVAQPDQAEILSSNAKVYLKKRGFAIIAIKARSVDVTKDPKIVYKQQVGILEASGFQIKKVLSLTPFDKDHAIAVAIKQ